MSLSGKKLPVKFPYRCGLCGRDMEFLHIINIDGKDYAVCDCEIQKMRKEPLERFTARLEASLPRVEKEYQEHLNNIKSLIKKLKDGNQSQRPPKML